MIVALMRPVGAGRSIPSLTGDGGRLISPKCLGLRGGEGRGECGSENMRFL